MRDFHFPGRSPAYAARGMAATSMPAATLAALDVLRSGGNALDAAIAAAALLAVIEPQSTGIGGDCFCLYARPGQPIVALNGSGRAPEAATIDRFEALGLTAIPALSAHAVTIPGAVAAWEKLLAAHGTRGLDDLLRPAIDAAEHGHIVTDRVAWDWAISTDRLAAGGAAPFLPPPRQGDRFRQPALAETLKSIARQGARAFYEGPVAADIVATLQARGGLHTEADFAAGLHAAEFVTPIHGPYRGYDVWECPPNGSGLAVLIMLGILEGFGPAPDGPLGLVRLHRHMEAARLAYRDRDAFIADPTQAEDPTARLTSPAYLATLRALIRDDRAMAPMPLPGEALLPPHRDTVYLAVVDRDGNACSFINSVFEAFGSGIYAAQSGVMLHNRGHAFRVERGHPNCIAPNKRPMHTIMPAMLTKDGRTIMPFGVMGGHFQPTGQSLLLTNMLDHGLDVQEAIDLPRLYPRLGRIEIERGIPAPIAGALTQLGHTVGLNEKPHGGAQAIWIDHQRGVLIGGSDPRKDGLALGY